MRGFRYCSQQLTAIHPAAASLSKLYYQRQVVSLRMPVCRRTMDGEDVDALFAPGLFAPIGVVKRLLQSEPEEAGILTFFSLPLWCLLVVIGLLVGHRLGVALFGVRRAVQCQAFTRQFLPWLGC